MAQALRQKMGEVKLRHESVASENAMLAAEIAAAQRERDAMREAAAEVARMSPSPPPAVATVAPAEAEEPRVDVEAEREKWARERDAMQKARKEAEELRRREVGRTLASSWPPLAVEAKRVFVRVQEEGRAKARALEEEKERLRAEQRALDEEIEEERKKQALAQEREAVAAERERCAILSLPPSLALFVACHLVRTHYWSSC